MTNYSEALELEKKFLHKFTKRQIFWMLLGNCSIFSKDHVEEYLDSTLKTLKKKNG